jgi:RNA polymerase sigma-70 factor (sigma-E family)
MDVRLSEDRDGTGMSFVHRWDDRWVEIADPHHTSKSEPRVNRTPQWRVGGYVHAPDADPDRDREFARFVAEHSGTLLRAAYVLTGSQARAEDVVQESLIKLFGAWDRVAGAQGQLAYARRIVYTTHVSVWRSRRRERLTDRVPDSAGTEDEFAVLDERDRLWRLTSRLPERQRAVVVLRYYEGLSEAEIAGVLQISEGSVKTHASRALAKLRAWEAASVGDAR